MLSFYPLRSNTAELLCQGYAHAPYEWAASTVNIQMLRVGNLVMLIIPGKLMLVVMAI
jgi:hypothetical protein